MGEQRSDANALVMADDGGERRKATRSAWHHSATICDLTRGAEPTNFEGEEKESQRILLYLKGTNRYSRQCISLLYLL
jgi:hypothetical protein